MEFDGVLQSRMRLLATGTWPLDAWINDPLTRTTELVFVEEIAGKFVDAVTFPTTWIIPVRLLKMPCPKPEDPVPASTFPVAMIVPVFELRIAVPADPVELPVILMIPLPLLRIAAEFAVVDVPNAFPVMRRVPVDVFAIP